MEINNAKPWENQWFSLRGFIKFSVMSSGIHLDEQVLKAAIETVDREFPQDLSGATMEDDDFGDRCYSFEIRPPFQFKISQCYVYHRYLSNLCEELSIKAIEGIGAVSFHMVIIGGNNTYHTPESRETFKKIDDGTAGVWSQRLRGLGRSVPRPPDDN